MVCAAIMRRRWRCRGWTSVAKGVKSCANRHWHSLARTSRRPFDGMDRSIGFALDRRCVKSQELTAPPQTLGPFFGHGREPILPNHSAYLARRLMRKWILGKKIENVAVIGKQPDFDVGHDRIVPP